jgi:hypothetical protein
VELRPELSSSLSELELLLEAERELIVAEEVSNYIFVLTGSGTVSKISLSFIFATS